MKKIVIILISLSFFLAEAKAQETPQYFTVLTAGINTGKNISGASEKELYGKVQGVYGGGKIGFAYHALKVMPMGKKHGMPLEAYTVVSLGVGKIQHLTDNSKVAFGGGPTVAMVPNFGSAPKTSSIYYGATAHANYVNSVHLGGDVTFVLLPPKNQHDYARNMLLAEFEATYFMSKIIGVKAVYGIEMTNQEERMIPGVPFFQNRNSETKSNLSGGICLRFGPAIIFAGPTIRTTGQKYSYLDQWGAFIDGKYSENPPMRMNVAINFNLEMD